MDKNKIIYLALMILLTLSSCVQEAPEPPVLTGINNRIFFRSYLPTVTGTRSKVTTNENLKECRVTCINPDDQPIDPETEEITPYFNDIRFEKDPDGLFLAEEADECIWPSTKGTLHFFAYHPAAETMQETIDKEKFNLVNHSRITDGSSVIDYRLESFQVAPDIADQIDFITAYSDGTRQDNGNTGIDLNFTHQLARIELMAWSESLRYDIEIAGVRIGNALTQGHFSFSSLLSSSGSGEWLDTKQSSIEHIFTEGESIIHLSRDVATHTDQEHAASIMGDSGPAMVIPMAERIEAWGGLEDPGLDTETYSTDKLYFSVLLRVKNWADEIVYPYYDAKYDIPAVYLVVGDDGKVNRRVYKINGDYYTVDKENEEFKYQPTETEEIRGFCWAALPVAAKWESGKIYTYKLNYTNGIGWHDPSYPIPGNPIIDDRVSVNVEVSDWKEGDKTDITVPRK